MRCQAIRKSVSSPVWGVFYAGLWVISAILCAMGIAPCTTEARDDWQLWVEQKWKVTLHSRAALMGRSDVRFRDDLGDFYKQTDNIGLSWKALPWLKLEPVYQYEWSEQANGDSTIENRLYLNAIPGWSRGIVHLEDRNRIEFRHVNSVDDWRYRNKPKLGVRLGHGAWALTPYVADEVFYGARAGEWNRNRIFLGVEKSFTKHLGLDLYYMIESNKQGRDWNEFHVLGLALSANF